MSAAEPPQGANCPGARSAEGSPASGQPSRFIGELAQEDLRYADAPRTAAEAADEKAAGNARLSNLKAMLR